MKDKIQKIIDKAYALIITEMEKNEIKVDSQTTDDCIFFNDTEQKKTFCIHVGITECDEYEGE